MCPGSHRQSAVRKVDPGDFTMSLSRSEGYSASIDIRLRVNGGEFRVAQVGESFIIMRDKITVPPERMLRSLSPWTANDLCIPFSSTKVSLRNQSQPAFFSGQNRFANLRMRLGFLLVGLVATATGSPAVNSPHSS